jgi:hypothetical protein
MISSILPTAHETGSHSDETMAETATPQPSDRTRGADARATVVRRTIVIVLLLALGVAKSSAQSFISVTASPVQLARSIAQVTGELKLIDNVSVAGFAGIGSRDGERVTFGGGQVRFYLTGGFDGGMHVGAEALFAQLGRSGSIEGVMGLLDGTSGGPFVGYKYVFGFGLTLDVQGGIRYANGRIETGAGDGGSGSGSDGKLSPLANVNVGWSF